MELAKKVQNLFENGKKTREEMIQAALKTSHTMLTIKQFIEVAEFKLDDVLPFDLMWNSFRDNIPIYVTNDLIRVFGYKGSFSDQKKNIMNLVKKYNIPVIQLNNNEYKDFLENLVIKDFYPLITKEQLKSKPLHLLISLKDFKLLLMVVNTINGHFVRKYYLNLEELFQKYLLYQCEFYKKSYYLEVKKIYELPHVMESNKLLKLEKLDMEISEKYKVGVIYFICPEDDKNIVKIGFTFNLPDRLSKLQTAHYKKLIVKNYYFTQFPQFEEKRLHKLYAQHNVMGEWFRL